MPKTDHDAVDLSWRYIHVQKENIRKIVDLLAPMKADDEYADAQLNGLDNCAKKLETFAEEYENRLLVDWDTLEEFLRFDLLDASRFICNGGEKLAEYKTLMQQITNNLLHFYNKYNPKNQLPTSAKPTFGHIEGKCYEPDVRNKQTLHIASLSFAKFCH